MFIGARLLGALLLIVLFIPVGFGTSLAPKTTVRGRIVDQNRAVVFGAFVTFKNAITASSVSTSSDSEGEFTLSLEPGD